MPAETDRACLNCGREVPLEATLCPGCGKALPALIGAEDPMARRLITGTSLGDHFLGFVLAAMTPFTVGAVCGLAEGVFPFVRGKRFGDHPGDFAILLIGPALSVVALAVAHHRLRNVFPVLAHAYFVIAVVLVACFPLGILSTCSGFAIGGAVMEALKR